MKLRGYTLEIDGELCPTWFNTNRKVLLEESHALRSPYGIAKVVPVHVNMTRRRAKK